MTTKTVLDVCSICTDGKCFECKHYDYVIFLNDPENYQYQEDGDLAWFGCALCVVFAATTSLGIYFIAMAVMG